MIPQDPVMLASFLNLKLRDEYDSFDSLCNSLDLDKAEIIDKLKKAGFTYREDQKQFR